MIDHATLHVSDIEKSKEFYTKTLKPFGYKVVSEMPEWKVVGMGDFADADVWLVGDGSDKAGHIAFVATSQEMVQKFHEAGVAAGGKDNGAPGYRKDYSPGYYAAFVIDPDGHNIEAIYKDPKPE
jgi:catechol 2,3-dioxygenase-like lactoylglutathione lyase family enzyme